MIHSIPVRSRFLSSVIIIMFLIAYVSLNNNNIVRTTHGLATGIRSGINRGSKNQIHVTKNRQQLPTILMRTNTNKTTLTIESVLRTARTNTITKNADTIMAQEEQQQQQAKRAKAAKAKLDSTASTSSTSTLSALATIYHQEMVDLEYEIFFLEEDIRHIVHERRVIQRSLL